MSTSHVTFTTLEKVCNADHSMFMSPISRLSTYSLINEHNDSWQSRWRKSPNCIIPVMSVQHLDKWHVWYYRELNTTVHGMLPEHKVYFVSTSMNIFIGNIICVGCLYYQHKFTFWSKNICVRLYVTWRVLWTSCCTHTLFILFRAIVLVVLWSCMYVCVSVTNRSNTLYKKYF